MSNKKQRNQNRENHKRLMEYLANHDLLQKVVEDAENFAAKDTGYYSDEPTGQQD